MNTKEKVVIRILLLIAKMFVGNEKIKEELQNLDNHIRYEKFEE